MGDARRAVCRGGCGRTRADEELSWNGYCGECGEAKRLENAQQMVARKGPNFDRWRRSMVLCAHPELVDVLDGKA